MNTATRHFTRAWRVGNTRAGKTAAAISTAAVGLASVGGFFGPTGIAVAAAAGAIAGGTLAFVSAAALGGC